MDGATDEAMELFNSFQLADAKDKPGILKSLAETCIRRPSVLDHEQLLDAVLQSRVDSHVNVRKGVLDFWDTLMAEVKDVRGDQVELGAGAVVGLLADENASVVKRAITSLPITLRWHFAKDDEGKLSGLVSQGLKKLEELALDDGSAAGIKLGASKALEQGITSPSITKQSAHQKSMNSMLTCFIKLLKKLKESETTGPLAVSCIRSCGSILTSRPQFAGKLVPVVLSFGQVEAYKNAKTAAALDDCVRRFVASGSQLAKPWSRKVNDCLVALGRDPLTDDRENIQGKKRTGAVDVGDGGAQQAGPMAPAGRSGKRARVDMHNDADKDAETRIRTRIEKYDAEGLFDLVREMPVDVAAEMAFKTLTSTRGVPRKNTVSQDVISVRICNLMLEVLSNSAIWAAAAAGVSGRGAQTAPMVATMAKAPPAMLKNAPPSEPAPIRAPTSKQDIKEVRAPASQHVVKGSAATAPPLPRVREFKDPLATPAAMTSEQASHQRLQALRRIMRGNGAAKARLVARLAVLFPVTDNAFEAVVSTIMQDYEGNEGHETFNLLLLMLFLEGSENGNDNGNGTGREAEHEDEQSNERYESALQIILDGLREALPETSKALPALLMEVPILPSELTAAFADGLLQDADPSTNSVGLVICRDVVLTRPRCRQQVLDLVLKVCTSSNANLRSKAIRMCTNQLFSENALQTAIETAAARFLTEAVNQAVASGTKTKDAADAADAAEAAEATDDTGKFNPDQLTDLYCALTTKKSSMLLALFQAYGASPNDSSIRKSLLDKCSNIAEAVGPGDKNVLSIIQAPPPGSEDLVMSVLDSFTLDMPGRPLVDSVLKYFEQHPNSLSFIVPVLPGMTKNEAIKLVPSLIQLPETTLIEAIMRLCTVIYEEQSAPVITPAEILTLLHMVDDRKLLKSTIAAINVCLGVGTLFTSEVLAASLSQLITRIPLPQLFMRTVIQSISVAPKLRGFIVDLLGQLVTNQIWTNTTQWKGWIMAAQQTAPDSFPAILRLPPSGNVLDQALTGLQPETRARVVERGLKESLPENVTTVLKKHQ